MDIIHAKDTNFASVLQENELVLVDFWATWCGPCRMIAPFIEKLADDYDGKLIVMKVDVDDCPAAAAQYGIMSIPTVILFKNGEPVSQMIGARPYDAYCEMVNANL